MTERRMTGFKTVPSRLVTGILTIALVLWGAPAPIARADNNQLIITPATGSTSVGAAAQTYSVKALFITSGTSPQRAAGTVTFPANLLQASATTLGSGWAGTAAVNQGQGTISFSLTRSSTDTGFSTLFTVALKPTAAGTAVISFSGDSYVNNSPTSYKSSVVTIASPAPPAAGSPPAPKPSVSVRPSTVPTPTVSVSPTPTPSTEPEPEDTPDPTGIVSAVQIQPRYNAATVTWKVNAPNPKSTATYGSSSSEMDKQAVVALTDGMFSTNITGLEPGKRYYFSIAGSGTNTATGTYTGTIVTSGLPVTMTITENDAPVKGAQIRVDSRTFTTAASGKASFGLATGDYKAVITTETASKTVELTIVKKTIPENGSAPESQTFAYNLTSSPLEGGPGSGTTILTFLGVLVGGTVVLAFGFLGFMAYRRNKFERSPVSSTPSSTVVIDDGYNWRQEQNPRPEAPRQPVEAPPQNASPQSRHNNSVYIDEEEPLDMFERPPGKQ